MIGVRKSSNWTSGWKESQKNRHEMVMEPCVEDDSDCSSADERSCEKDEDDNDKEAEQSTAKWQKTMTTRKTGESCDRDEDDENKEVGDESCNKEEKGNCDEQESTTGKVNTKTRMHKDKRKERSENNVNTVKGSGVRWGTWVRRLFLPVELLFVHIRGFQ